MMYHAIDYAGHPKDNMVSPENFSRQMNYLKNHGYKVISLDELVRGIKEKRSFPQKAAVISFDDGYQDNYRYAFPVLKKNQFPATIFMPFEQVDQQRYLTAAEIKEMIKYNITIGSHTLNQAYLPSVTNEEKLRQIEMSKKFLEKKLGHPIEYISYPSGGFSEEIKRMVKEAGYQGACTTNRGYHRFNEDVYELKRVRFSNKDRWGLILWAKLSGYYNLFRSLKDPF